MKTLFYVLLALWLGGAVLGFIMGGYEGQAFFVNLFGIPAIIVGIILLIKKVTGKGKHEEERPPTS